MDNKNIIIIALVIAVGFVAGCLLDTRGDSGDVTYPENMSKIRDIVADSYEINIIWDGRISARDYPKSFNGTQALYHAIGVLSSSEGSPEYVYSYIKENESCYLDSSLTFKDVPKPFSQPALKTPQSCDIDQAIYILVSDKNEVRIEGSRIYLLGDDEHLYEEEINVSRVIAPAILIF